LNSFWSGIIAPGANVFDPRILYDPYAQRWIFTATSGINLTNDPGLLIAVSRTPDPTGQWNRYFIDVDTNVAVYADSPNTGFNKSRIIVQANMFYKNTNGHYGSFIYAFNKTNLYAGGVGLRKLFMIPNVEGQVDAIGPPESAPVPAVTYDANLG